jgi:hypothetical protein
MVLGEDPQDRYDPQKFAQRRPNATHAAQPPLVRQPLLQEPLSQPPPTRLASELRPQVAPEQLYGSHGNEMAANPSAQQEPSSLGCWLVSQPGTMWPVRQDLKVDTIPLQARTAIASACVAPIGCGSAALYDPESFMSPIETSQPVVATGSLINTYTGEVSDLFEDAMPPPDNGRDAGDAVRERKQAQRRLMAANGNVNASHHKREQQTPIQPGDAGVVTQLANFQINADVATEFNERANRDLFFNRNELAPTELEMTRNPFGFEGYNNRVRINPYLLPTQDLDDKDWVPNATLLPGGDHRPKHKTKLRRERPRTDYAGQATGQQAGDGRADVRHSLAARDEEGLTDASRCVNAQALYGDAAVVASGAQRLGPERAQGAWAATSSLEGQAAVVASGAQRLGPERAQGAWAATSSLEGQAAVTAASVMASLGFRGSAQVEVPKLATGTEKAAVASSTAEKARRRELGEALDVGQRRAVAGQDVASVHGEAQRAARAPETQTSQRRAVDGLGAGAFAGGEQRRKDERRAAPRTDLGSTPAVAAGALGLQRQALGGSDARTVDPASLFSTLTGFEGAALSAAQTLAADTRQQSEALRNSQGHEADRAMVAAVTLRNDEALYGDAAPLNIVGLGAAAPHGTQQHRNRKLDLDGAERAAAPHLNGGFAERNAAVTARNARGEGFAAPRDGLKVGGDVDFQKRPTAALREWKAELLTRPSVTRSAGSDGQRCTLLPAREARQARVAKSPYRALALRERTGIDARLAEPRESRYETDED